MKSAEHELAAATSAAAEELDAAARTIHHCLRQLTDEQVWWRPAASMNSIANLVLHMCGNVRQWIVAGVGGAVDNRDRPAEFSEQGPIPKDELLDRLDRTLIDAKAAMAGASGAELLRVRRIQGFETNGIGAIFHSVAHFRGHTQEIVHMTRCQLGDAYQFAFVPESREQGAP